VLLATQAAGVTVWNLRMSAEFSVEGTEVKKGMIRWKDEKLGERVLLRDQGFICGLCEGSCSNACAGAVNCCSQSILHQVVQSSLFQAPRNTRN